MLHFNQPKESIGSQTRFGPTGTALAIPPLIGPIHVPVQGGLFVVYDLDTG